LRQLPVCAKHAVGQSSESQDKEVMPMEQFLLAVLSGVLVALIVHWLGLNK
jgi:hypothetical protein